MTELYFFKPVINCWAFTSCIQLFLYKSLFCWEDPHITGIMYVLVGWTCIYSSCLFLYEIQREISGLSWFYCF